MTTAPTLTSVTLDPDGTPEVVLIDQDSFGEVEYYQNLVAFPTSVFATVIQNWKEDKDMGCANFQNAVKGYFQGYFGSSAPQQVDLNEIKKVAFSHAIFRMLSKPNDTMDNASLISSYVGGLASDVLAGKK